MKLSTALLITLLPALALAEESPYKGMEGRAIKALSSEEIEGLEQGRGMGLAMPAELNHFPGPKHVLELADGLELDEGQRRGVQASFDRMHDKAVRLGREIVKMEAELDALFAEGRINEKILHARVRRLGSLRGELRFVHLTAHLETRRLLTDDQVARYDELRGYGTGDGHPGHQRPEDCPHASTEE